MAEDQTRGYVHGAHAAQRGVAGGPVSGSFRDPSGRLFTSEGTLYRRVNPVYSPHYDHLMSSGLYDDLVRRGLLVAHTEVELEDPQAVGAYRVLKPEPVPFISYPYEWCFGQLKDAALATLDIHRTALDHGMILKDASAYNIQFVGSRATLIDTLSFEIHEEGSPWIAYRQFCQHFLAPLALMSMKDVRFGQLLRVYIDGVPLDLASPLLPFRTRLKFSFLLHIHLHAKSQKRYQDSAVGRERFAAKVSRQAMLGLIDSLRSCVASLKWAPKGTEWVDYYQDDSYTPDALEQKKRIVAEYLEQALPSRPGEGGRRGVVWDLGANTGEFSRIAAAKGARVISFDIDPACVEVNYRESVKRGETDLLPLILDLTNPSPAIGWANDERMALHERGPADTIMALALIHHLAISNNVPLPKIADYFAGLCSSLIIEFVPKSDRKVMKLLASREDVFPDYTQEGFEKAFGGRFETRSAARIPGSERTLYLMERR